MARPAPNRDAVIAALREHGPMTSAEIAAVLEWDTKPASRCIMHARQESPGQFFRVVRYKAITGKWAADQPVYALGPGPDRPKPKFNAKARQSASSKRARTKKRAELNAKQRAARGSRPQSIWAQLVPLEHRRLMRADASNTTMSEAA